MMANSSVSTVETLVESFERGRGALPGPGLAATRGSAIAAFAREGFPTPRLESWKYTNLNRLSRAAFDPLADVAPVTASDWADLRIDGADVVVVANGRYDAAASSVGALPAGTVLAPLSLAIDGVEKDLANEEPGAAGSLVALNTAFMRDGLVLRLPKGAVLNRPVQVLHIVDGGATGLSVHPRTVIEAGEGAEATVIETFAGAGEAATWTNAVTEICVGANARIRHYKRQSETEAAYHTAVSRVRLDRDAHYEAVALATGAALSRNEIRVSFEGSGADAELRGGALLRGRQHADNTTEADHRVPHTSSRQVFRNVLDGRSRSVFQGGVIVEKDAQKTDSSQSNRNLLLSAGAQADTKPELRIFADDVKCAHGATVGDLDRTALFYLNSRGIPPDEAKALLICAFVGEIVETIGEEAVKAHFDAAIAGWMAGLGGEKG
jgi:Fe-S cluster assembly protein SufD